MRFGTNSRALRAHSSVALTLALALVPRVSSAQDRPDAPGSSALFRFDEGDAIEHFDGERTRVHFTRDGRNAVPSDDTDASGVPDFVELVAMEYDAALAYYAMRGFREPLSDESLTQNGGDAHFDVYLVDFGGNADGAFQIDGCTGATCVGYMVQENDYRGYSYPNVATAIGIVSSHELFHAVQAAYDHDQGNVFSEGTAVWASDQFEPTFGETAGFSDGFLSRPTRPLDQESAGVVLDQFAYGASIFFQFLSEYVDVEIVRLVLEGVVDGAGGVADPHWLDVLVAILDTEYGLAWEDVFVEFATWNMLTGSRASGQPEAQTYSNAIGLPPVELRLESLPLADERPRHFYAATRYYGFSPAGRTQVSARLVGDTEGLVVRIVSNAETPLLISPMDESPLEADIDTTGATQVIVAVVNTNREGDSKRASVCVGTAEEVETCVSGFESTMDAGVPDGGVMMDGAVMTPVGDGGGCNAAPRPSFFALFVLGLGLALHARRRQRG